MAESAPIKAHVENVSFRGAGLLDAQLDKSHFVNCDFRDTNLREGEAIETHFVDCDFRGADFELRRLKGTVFTRCKFAGSHRHAPGRRPIQGRGSGFLSCRRWLARRGR